MRMLGKYWPYCTRNRAITNAYMKYISYPSQHLPAESQQYKH